MLKPKHLLSLALLFIACNLTTNNALASLRKTHGAQKPIFSYHRLYSSSSNTAPKPPAPQTTQTKLRAPLQFIKNNKYVVAFGVLIFVYSCYRDYTETYDYQEKRRKKAAAHS